MSDLKRLSSWLCGFCSFAFPHEPNEISHASFSCGVLQGPSVEEWVVGTLREKGPQTLDQLGEALPQANWAQLLFAIDRLSRRRDITCGFIPTETI
jgi:hypothetical protein